MSVQHSRQLASIAFAAPPPPGESYVYRRGDHNARRTAWRLRHSPFAPFLTVNYHSETVYAHAHTPPNFPPESVPTQHQPLPGYEPEREPLPAHRAGPAKMFRIEAERPTGRWFRIPDRYNSATYYRENYPEAEIRSSGKDLYALFPGDNEGDNEGITYAEPPTKRGRPPKPFPPFLLEGHANPPHAQMRTITGAPRPPKTLRGEFFPAELLTGGTREFAYVGQYATHLSLYPGTPHPTFSPDLYSTPTVTYGEVYSHAEQKLLDSPADPV